MSSTGISRVNNNNRRKSGRINNNNNNNSSTNTTTTANENVSDEANNGSVAMAVDESVVAGAVVAVGAGGEMNNNTAAGGERNDSDTVGAVVGKTNAATVTPHAKDAISEFESEQEKSTSMLSLKARKGLVYDAIAKVLFRHTKYFSEKNKREREMAEKIIVAQVCEKDCAEELKIMVIGDLKKGYYSQLMKQIVGDRRGSIVEASEKKGKSELSLKSRRKIMVCQELSF